jgi:hypothetical protein
MLPEGGLADVWCWTIGLRRSEGMWIVLQIPASQKKTMNQP